MYRKFYKKSQKYSWLVLVLLFFIGTIIPPVVAQVSAPASITQTNLYSNPAKLADLRLSSTNPNQLVQEAKDLYQKQKYKDALPLWRSSAQGFTEIGEIVNSAIALGNLSLTYQKLGQWDEANKAIQSSLKLLNSEVASDSLILAHAWDILGKLQRETGKSTEAIETWQQAANIYQRQNDTASLQQNYLNQSQALQDLGLYPRACKRILNILSLDNISTCKQLGQLTDEQLKTEVELIITKKPSVTTVSALRNLGDLLLILGQPKQSEFIFKAIIIPAQELDLPQELSLAHLRLGNIYLALAIGEVIIDKRIDYKQQAIEAYQKAIKESTSPKIKLKAQLNQLNFLIEQREWKKAESLWITLLPQVTDANLVFDRQHIYSNINYAQNIIKVKQLNIKNNHDVDDVQLPTNEEIEQILIDAAEKAQQLGDRRIEAQAWGTLGKLDEITKTYLEAEINTIKALNLISKDNDPDIAFQYYWQLGRINKEQKNILNGIYAYTEAYNALQSLRSDIAAINPEVQFSFREEVEPVYRELVELDIEYAESLDPKTSKAEQQKILLQARNVVESLQIAQLNNFFREACVDANPQLIDQLDSSTAVVYPIILEDKLEILLSLPDGSINLYKNKSNVSKDKLKDTVEHIKDHLESLNPLERFLPQCQEVYDWLIRPIENEIPPDKIKTLAFVLDGSLRSIPMSVLHDGHQYLVEKYALALTPGLQLLNPKSITEVELEVVTAGLIKMNPDSKLNEGFSNLPEVKQELDTIRDLEIVSSSIRDGKFTKKALKQNISSSGAPIVHLATHAKFSSQVEDTFILAWDGRINIRDLDDLMRDDTYRRKNAIELLVLSACETAEGDDRAALGLAGVAVQAGARSTLATLWKVLDESTAMVMDNFYSQLKNSQINEVNKAKVLQKAQLKLLNGQEYRHPHYWAPFILVGNWQ